MRLFTFWHGPGGTLGRNDTRSVVLTRDLRAAVVRQRAAARVHRAQGGLQEHPRRLRRQPARLSRRAVIAHVFHHNAFLIVSNGHRAKYDSITSLWEHFSEWKRLDERDKGSIDAEVLLNGMLAHDRLLDLVENYRWRNGPRRSRLRQRSKSSFSTRSTGHCRARRFQTMTDRKWRSASISMFGNRALAHKGL